MGCIVLVRCVLVLRCGLAGVVWYPDAGFSWSLHPDTTPPHEITNQISRKLLRMDVSTSETCWAVNNEITKQVTSSWSLFIRLSRWCRFNKHKIRHIQNQRQKYIYYSTCRGITTEEKYHNKGKEWYFKEEICSNRNSDTQSSSSAKLNEIYYYVHPTRIILKIQRRLESLLKYSGEETTRRKKLALQNL